MVARSARAIPPFLRKTDPSAANDGAYTETVFTHSDGLGSAHSIWWHPAVSLAESTVILFVPGNPGLAAFYTEYLSELHSRSPILAILAHSHLAHTPRVLDQQVFTNPSSVGLPAQLKSAIEAFDAVKHTLQPKNIVLVGHSLGGWLCLQVRLPGIVLHLTVLRFRRYLKPARQRFLAPSCSFLQYATWQLRQTAGNCLWVPQWT